MASTGAGLTATLNAAQLDQDFGSDAANILNALDRAHRRYLTYWQVYGSDGTFGYQALKTAAGDAQASTDYNNMATAVTLMEKLYQACQGNATIAVDGSNGGNGTVTVGANGSGFNFFTFLARIAGDNVQ
jgi:hypothetical protein